MTILQGFYQLLFGPLELLFELIYGVARDTIGSAGAAIIPLSLCMNFLALPFYNRADAIQREERERQARMAPGIVHIKKAFKADERYMMLQAFYRINGYKPIYALRSSLPLLLEIPFFVAAYHFLSNLGDLIGAQFGILANLGLLWLPLVLLPAGNLLSLLLAPPAFDARIWAFSLLAAVAEELLFRWGLLKTLLLPRVRPGLAVALVSVLFAALHLLNLRNGTALPAVLAQVFCAFAFSVWAGAAVHRSGRVRLALLAHLLLNLTAVTDGLLFPLLAGALVLADGILLMKTKQA